MENIMINEIQSTKQQKNIALSHPWRRFFARSVDNSIYLIIWLCVQYFVFRWHPEGNFFIKQLINYITYILVIIIEPLLLCTWGTTPGKGIFGLLLRSRSGDKLTYIEALGRTWGMFGSGYGYGIPVYGSVRMYKCYKASLNGEIMSWDYEYDTDYQLTDLKVMRIAVYIVAEIFLLAITFGITLQSQMPLHRGNITPIQYAENINDILTRPNTHQGVYMDENGYWQRKKNTDNILYIPVTSLPNHQLTVENGIVTGVSLILENDGKSSAKYIPSSIPVTQKSYMTQAFFSAQKSTNCFTLINPEIKKMIESIDSFDIEFRGIRITQEIEHRGYMVVNNGFWPQNDVPQKFKMKFSMKLVK